MTGTVEIIAVNLDEMVALTSEGGSFPITNLFDIDGEDCEPEDAITAVCGADQTWFSLDLREFGATVQ